MTSDRKDLSRRNTFSHCAPQSFIASHSCRKDFFVLLCGFPLAVEWGSEGVVKGAVNQLIKYSYFLSNPTKSASKIGRDFWEDGLLSL